jgi:hypothetical protein
MVEQRIHNPYVVGSSPTSGKKRGRGSTSGSIGKEKGKNHGSDQEKEA